MSDTRLTLPHWDALTDLADNALQLLPTALLIARRYPQPGRHRTGVRPEHPEGQMTAPT